MHGGPIQLRITPWQQKSHPSIPVDYATEIVPLRERKGFHSTAPRFADERVCIVCVSLRFRPLRQHDLPGPGVYAKASTIAPPTASYSRQGYGNLASKVPKLFLSRFLTLFQAGRFEQQHQTLPTPSPGPSHDPM